MQRKPLTKPSCKQHFENIGCNIHTQANRKNNDPVLKRVLAKCSSGAKPKNKNTGVKCIDQETAGKYFSHVALSETHGFSFCICAQCYFLEEQVIYTHNHQESAAYISNEIFIFQYVGYQVGKC